VSRKRLVVGTATTAAVSFSCVVAAVGFRSGEAVEMISDGRTGEVVAPLVPSDRDVVAHDGSSSVESVVRPSARETACPDGQYLARYWSNTTRAGEPSNTRCEPAPLRHDWSTAGPSSSMTDQFSARYEGRFSFEAAEYEFVLDGDNGVRLWIDGNLAIDQWHTGTGTYNTTRAMTAGRHNIRVEYFEQWGGAKLEFDWIKKPPPPAPGYTFYDDFNGTKIDPTKWTFEGDDWNAYDSDFETGANTTVSNGQAHIKIETDPSRRPASRTDTMMTKGRYTQQYGKFAARMKLPRGKGLWPALWLWNPASPPEIDVFEVYANPTLIHGLDVQHTAHAIHWGSCYGCPQHGQKSAWLNQGIDMTADWHVWAIEWRPTYVEWFIDGRSVLRVNQADPSAYGPVQIPQKPLHIAASLAAGGWNSRVDSTTPPVEYMHIDWIRTTG
jgi:hypothetical protein